MQMHRKVSLCDQPLRSSKKYIISIETVSKAADTLNLPWKGVPCLVPQVNENNFHFRLPYIRLRAFLRTEKLHCCSNRNLYWVEMMIVVLGNFTH